jgi:hypothetical protein
MWEEYYALVHENGKMRPDEWGEGMKESDGGG